MLIVTLPVRANPTHDAKFEAWLSGHFRDMPRASEGVTVDLPALAENGNSVPLTVSADSPMQAQDFIRTIDIYAPQNPMPHLGRFHFSPSSGVARVNTRIRLGGDQTVRVVARASTDRLLLGGADIVVTEAACLDFLF
ncbi:MAG: thiosulfate oxidation carrier protein SoxY [Pseudomonadota bacterium]